MKDLIKTISRPEWRFLVLMTALLILITGLPFLIGYLAAPADTVYDGLHALSPGDFPVYYSYINQVKAGNFLVKDLFTSEQQGSGTFNVWWVLVGLFAKIFNLPAVLAFQLSRLLMIPIFIFIAYLFIAYLLPEKIQRKVCLFFLLFSSGLGVYAAASPGLLKFEDGSWRYWWPIDLWLTESNTFNALYQTSHFIASIAIMLLIFLLMLLAFDKKNISYVLASGFLSLFYFNFHPYYFPVIFGVLGIYLFILFLQAKKILWVQSLYLAIVFLISLPSVFYHFWLIGSDQVIAQRAVQNITNISPLIFVAAGYGFLLFGFVLGLFFLIKNKNLSNHFIFLLVWLGVNIFLIYSPFPFHSRYTQGLQVIFVIFTVVGLFGAKDFLAKRLEAGTFNFWVNNPFLLFIIFVILFLPSVFFSVFRDYYYFILKPGQTKVQLYLPKDFFKAAAWLKNQSGSRIVLAAEIPSMFIPAFGLSPVYVAHGHETLFYYAKRTEVIWFFADNKNDEAKAKFLKKQGIDYIFYSDYEKELGDFNPATKSYLKLVFNSPQAQILEVVKD
ncbi:MAG: hypothetical protein WC768_04520 [Patescibacteria group bacterium]|jgi:hypothetical protein